MNFWKTFFAAFLAIIASSVFSFIFALMVIGGVMASMGESPIEVKEGSVLKIDLAAQINDKPTTDPLAQIDFSTMETTPTLSLLQVLCAIEAAADDDNIEGIYIEPSGLGVSMANLEEIRNALIQFKESGKFIIAYNSIFSQSGYYISSVADKIYLEPEGSLSWQGLASNIMFYKGLLDKLDIKVEVFRPTVCKYKSAVEPYIRSNMSEPNRLQMEQILGSFWSVIAQDVADARGLTLDEVNAFADNLIGMDPEAALEAKMVDGLIYEDQLGAIYEDLGVELDEDSEKPNYISLNDYATLHGSPVAEFSADKVAIIYAEGSIVDGEGGKAGNIFGNSTAATIRKARLDDDIKAVVLRVNSPGGSALASDIMWREIELLREVKPVIVSMGGAAASGGYYISAPADAIIADKLTVTGSIGVFGMMPNVEDALQSKLGITTDTAKSNTHADFMQSLKGLSSYERQVILKSVDKVYERFTSLVAEGRNLELDHVLDIAQGRVWSGQDAIEIGLVDSIGGLKDAIMLAATRANIADKFRITEILDEPTGLAAILAQFEASVSAKFAKAQTPSELDLLMESYKKVHEALAPITTKDGMVMYYPYSIELQ